MTTRMEGPTTRDPARPLAWIVPGPLRQLTGGYLYDARIVDGLRARGWPVGVVDVRSRRWPLDLAAGRRLVAALRRETWGAIVVDELAHPAVAAARLCGHLRRGLVGAPLIVLVHHLRCSEPAGQIPRAVAFAAERLALRSADLVVCTSETTARTVRPLVRSGIDVEVVRPGWNTHAPSRCSSGGTAEAGHLLSLAACQAVGTEHPLVDVVEGKRGEGLFRLLLVAHWTPRKAVLDALAAVARLGRHVTLDLVGEQDRDPDYAARVRLALRDPALTGRVHAHGLVAADALARLYARSDALVLASTHEGYGMVLAEALAAGLPIVATRVGAVPEVVRDGFEAALVPAGDVAALARAIDRLADDPGERRRRARLAREQARTLPHWSESVVAFEGHLQALLTRRRSDS
jgi:glycosyltransferase involved in cell wall biosynthesis